MEGLGGESEERARRSVLRGPPLLALLDPAGVVRDVNAAWVEGYRTKAGDATRCDVGADYLAVCERATDAGEAYAREAAAGIRAVLSGERESSRLEYSCAQRDFEMLVTPLAGGGAAVLHVDVTEERATRKRLDDSEARFEAAARASHDALYVLEALRDEAGELCDFRLAAVNPAAERQMLVPAGELLGRTLFELVPASVASSHFETLKQVVLTGRPHTGELEIPAPAAAAGWYHSQVVPLGDRVVITTRDISQAKRLELELLESRERLLAVTRAAPAVVYQYQRLAEGGERYSFVSEGARELWGLEPEQVIEDPSLVRALTHPEDLPLLEHRVEESRTSLEPLQAEVRVVLDGETRWHGARSIPRQLPDGSTEWTGVVVDITTSKREEARRLELERQILAAQKLESLGLLAGGVAHDFNNLLVAMLGHASLGKELLEETHPATECLSALVAAAEHAAALTRQMLAYAGRASIAARTTDLGALVRESQELLRSAVSRSAALDITIPEPPPRVSADPSQVQQALMNLVMNAAEALRETGGTISISVARLELGHNEAGQWRDGGAAPAPGHFAVLRVEDTGPGIPEEIRARVFDPFVSTRGEGRGLGLSAVGGIVRGHRGGLRLETGARGTRVDLLFPIAAAVDQPVPPPSGPAQSAERRREAASGSAQGEQRQILIIDDDEHVTRLIARVLRREGIEALSAGDGATGIARFKERQAEIALVVLDLSMPGLSGEETLAGLRAVSTSVPVLLSSGLPPHEVRERFDQLGADGFLEKPYTARRLLETVQRLLEP